ncbi:hypothetical protein VW35_09150 [Devosia soli]|uniref:Lipoprotein n=1 Tax=Devosia soli TaxID=361041 RepID=A0A0F5L8H2_9HYPH|nr:hypothetical protein [Devosia soli]KKB78681.1 hypothetical protein VW35_09150 [Devosia soli]
MLKAIGKFAILAAFGAALAGCVDATVDVAITGDTTARATLTEVMSADFYAMMRTNAEAAKPEDEPLPRFCAEGTLRKSADGSATCTIIEEGEFASLTSLGNGPDDIAFTPAGPGLVRVTLPTAGIAREVNGALPLDPASTEMIEAYFSGRTITISVSGAEITDTNMELAKDGKSAKTVISMLDLFNGTAELPDQLFAVVRAP